MLYVVSLARALSRDKRGVTALEYGLIAGAIALAIITAVGTLGTNIAGVFSNLANQTW
jgi:pilus assembly protein Flp/PilA